MKPSNMSPNKLSFGGVLQPLVESLERNPRHAGRLAGQDVVISGREDVQAIIALDADNDIHLLISPSTDDHSRLSRLDLKGLKITNREWSVAERPVQEYLDITCSTGTLPSFRRPFLRFAEDALFEISKPESLPADAVYRTGIRWRRFWSSDSAEFTKEWLHGIFGELSFMAEIIEKSGPGLIHNWTGPQGADHDFQAGKKIAVEVKTSVEMPFRIHANLSQLDPSIFEVLYLVCYKVTSSVSGETLPELVGKIESLIGEDESILDIFYTKLALAGYKRESETTYAENPLTRSPGAIFLINESFPKIVESSFTKPPDHRITGIRYELKITGVEELTFEQISPQLTALSGTGV